MSGANEGIRVRGTVRARLLADGLRAPIRLRGRRAGGRAIGVSAEVSDFAAIERMRERVEEELGIVEVLVAFAASGGPLPGPTAQITEEEWRSAMDGNLTSAFLTLKSFLPGMVERGSGSIVTMASSAGRVPTQAPTAYAAAKAGVVMLSRQVAVEVARHGVRVNCLAPDSILTERLLFASGVIDEIGSVDDGSTRTDSLALEQKRGITIKSAVVSFVVADTTINLIDTPGHPDFIAEE
jgi:NAD(P)-dependent dehydrogenase (short-subunit alcohol dehydrogenase family)